MLGIGFAVAALGSYLLLALVAYPALKGVTLWSLPAGTWLLLLACPIYLIQALAYIARVEQREAAGAKTGSSSPGEEGP